MSDETNDVDVTRFKDLVEGDVFTFPTGKKGRPALFVKESTQYFKPKRGGESERLYELTRQVRKIASGAPVEATA